MTECECVVCLDLPVSHACVPCGHVALCATCADQLTARSAPCCPICRRLLSSAIRLYGTSSTQTLAPTTVTPLAPTPSAPAWISLVLWLLGCRQEPIVFALPCIEDRGVLEMEFDIPHRLHGELVYRDRVCGESVYRERREKLDSGVWGRRFALFVGEQVAVRVLGYGPEHLVCNFGLQGQGEKVTHYMSAGDIVVFVCGQ